jgi:hypothetical protein
VVGRRNRRHGDDVEAEDCVLSHRDLESSKWWWRVHATEYVLHVTGHGRKHERGANGANHSVPGRRRATTGAPCGGPLPASHFTARPRAASVMPRRPSLDFFEDMPSRQSNPAPGRDQPAVPRRVERPTGPDNSTHTPVVLTLRVTRNMGTNREAPEIHVSTPQAAFRHTEHPATPRRLSWATRPCWRGPCWCSKLKATVLRERG